MNHIEHVGEQGRFQVFLGQFLLHVTEPAPLRNGDMPAVNAFHACYHAEERGLTHAVGATDAQMHPRFDVQREVGKDVAPAEGLGNFL